MLPHFAHKQRDKNEIEKIRAKIIYAIRARGDTHPVIFISNISHSFGLCLKVCSTTIKEQRNNEFSGSENTTASTKNHYKRIVI